MRLILVAILAAIILPGTSAQAWTSPERVASIYVEIDDQVTGGCWPRPQATKEAVELVFRQAGIIIAEDRGEFHELSRPPGYASWEKLTGKEELEKLTLNASDKEETNDSATQFISLLPHVFRAEALGYLHADLVCAVSVNVHLSKDESLYEWQQPFLDISIPTGGSVDYGSRSYIVTGGKSVMQADITDFAVEQATSLANAILKARTEYGLTTRK